eukprot:Gb_23371 [translate_table: standard]
MQSTYQPEQIPCLCSNRGGTFGTPNGTGPQSLIFVAPWFGRSYFKSSGGERTWEDLLVCGEPQLDAEARELSSPCSGEGVGYSPTLKVKRTRIEQVNHQPHSQKAQIASSRTSSLAELRRCTKFGTTSWSVITRGCSEVPDAMFVKAHAASN